MGDFNINLLQYRNNNKTTCYVDNIISRGFVPLTDYPTRVTQSTATLLDHIYTNTISKDSISGIIITDIADRFGTFYLSRIKGRNCSEQHREI